VAYRVGQLRELFGEELNDPDRRLAIELALRASRP
jgi:DNA-binding PucR family transcriptional regulator